MERVVVLDNVRSVHNVGSIFRTADGAGFSRAVLVGITPTPEDRFGRLRSDFKKVALGAEEHIKWSYIPTITRAVKSLRREGFKILALEQAEGSFRYDRIPKEFLNGDRVAIIVGAEVEGISKKVITLSDGVVEIPMGGLKESLNVSVAFGIIAYELSPFKKLKTPRKTRG